MRDHRLTAKEAAALATEKVKEHSNLDNILNDISARAVNGHFNLLMREALCGYDHRELKKLGYHIVSEKRPNGIVNIHWGDSHE